MPWSFPRRKGFPRAFCVPYNCPAPQGQGNYYFSSPGNPPDGTVRTARCSSAAAACLRRRWSRQILPPVCTAPVWSCRFWWCLWPDDKAAHRLHSLCGLFPTLPSCQGCFCISLHSYLSCFRSCCSSSWASLSLHSAHHTPLSALQCQSPFSLLHPPRHPEAVFYLSQQPCHIHGSPYPPMPYLLPSWHISAFPPRK